MIGQTYGFWKVLSMAEPRRCIALCLKCNTEHNVATYNLRNGRSEMCRECFTEKGHGHNYRNSPTYRTWNCMKQRCSNPRHRAWKDYGGRGIKVCARWMEFLPFLEDMGIGPRQHTIERIDNQKNYEPGNSRWATMSEQHRNKRNNHRVLCDGKEMIAKDAATELGMKYSTLLAWLNKHLDFTGDLRQLKLVPVPGRNGFKIMV